MLRVTGPNSKKHVPHELNAASLSFAHSEEATKRDNRFKFSLALKSANKEAASTVTRVKKFDKC